MNVFSNLVFLLSFSLVIISESFIYIILDDGSFMTQRNATVKNCYILKACLYSLYDSLRKSYGPINNLIIIQLYMLKHYSHFLDEN